MASFDLLQPRRDALQAQYDALSEKLLRLRRQSAIEAGVSVQFQVEKEIERAEADLDRIGQQQLARIDDPGSYVRWGPLGRSFLQGDRAVVLIDDIDKAHIDFPNDLLLELDERQFLVEETGHRLQSVSLTRQYNI
jgi:hypothetical protein